MTMQVQYGKDHDLVFALGEVNAIGKTIYQPSAYTALNLWELMRVLADSFQ